LIIVIRWVCDNLWTIHMLQALCNPEGELDAAAFEKVIRGQLQLFVQVERTRLTFLLFPLEESERLAYALAV
jgi:hypothetical protein